MACTTRSCTVEVRNANRNRFYTVFEVRANRCAEEAELIFVSRFNADDRVGPKDIRAQIESTAAFKGRNIILVGTDDFVDSFHEHIFRNRRHFKPFCRVHQAFCILVRTEGNGTAVFGLVRFQAFKDLLAVLQNAGTFIEDDIRIIRQFSFAPFTVFIIGNVTLCNRLIFKA